MGLWCLMIAPSQEENPMYKNIMVPISFDEDRDAEEADRVESEDLAQIHFFASS